MLPQEFSSLHPCIVQLLCLSLSNSEQGLTNEQLPSACCILASSFKLWLTLVTSCKGSQSSRNDVVDISLTQLFKCK